MPTKVRERMIAGLKRLTPVLTMMLIAAPVSAQTISTNEAYQRLQQRIAERQASVATQPAVDQIEALKAENAHLKEIIADLQRQLDALKGDGTTKPVVAADEPVGYTSDPATQPQSERSTPPDVGTPTGHTATGIPTYTGPRGGIYHYSKSGKKVYEKKKK